MANENQNAAPDPELAPASTILDRSEEVVSAALGLAPKSAESTSPSPDAAPPQPSAPTNAADAPKEQAEAATADDASAEESAAGDDSVPVLNREPLTKFSVFDPNGELEVPELYFTYEANGKAKERVPIDKLVQLAQMGHYNHEKYQEAQQALVRAQQAEAQLAQTQQTLQQYEQYYEALFKDENFYYSSKEQFERENTPEAQLQRERQKLQAERAQIQQQQETAAVAQYVQTALVPRVEQIIQQYPNISQQEIVGRFTELTLPLMVNGRVPPRRIPEVQALIDNDLRIWASEQHEAREQKITSAVEEKRRAIEEAARAKRQLARAVAAPAAPAPKAPLIENKNYESAQDWMSDLTKRVAAAAQGA